MESPRLFDLPRKRKQFPLIYFVAVVVFFSFGDIKLDSFDGVMCHEQNVFVRWQYFRGEKSTALFEKMASVSSRLFCLPVWFMHTATGLFAMENLLSRLLKFDFSRKITLWMDLLPTHLSLERNAAKNPYSVIHCGRYTWRWFHYNNNLRFGQFCKSFLSQKCTAIFFHALDFHFSLIFSDLAVINIRKGIRNGRAPLLLRSV